MWNEAVKNKSEVLFLTIKCEAKCEASKKTGRPLCQGGWRKPPVLPTTWRGDECGAAKTHDGTTTRWIYRTTNLPHDEFTARCNNRMLNLPHDLPQYTTRPHDVITAQWNYRTINLPHDEFTARRNYPRCNYLMMKLPTMELPHDEFTARRIYLTMNLPLD